MPTWSNKLPSEKKHMGYDIRRTPQASPLQAIITCNELLVCDTHYWGGRTLPCERIQQNPDGSITAGNCAACNEAMPYRTHTYVSAFDCKTREHFIFECTAHAARPLADYREANKSLRGCIFRASRPKCLKNAKVVIETNAANLAKVNLPDAPDLILALSTIWRLPTTGLRTAKKKRGTYKIATYQPQMDRMRIQPDNQPEPTSIQEILSGNGSTKKRKSTQPVNE